MKQSLDQLEAKLISKSSLPTDKNLQVSYFSKLLEQIQEFSNTIFRSTKEEINLNIKKIEQIINLIFNFNISDYVNADPFAKTLGLVYILLMKKDYSTSSFLFQALNSNISSSRLKSGSKLMILSLINFLMTNRDEVESFSLMILQEILNNVLKLLKGGAYNNIDISIKLNGLNIIRFMLREKLANNQSNRQEIYKLIIRNFSEKNDDIKILTANILRDFIEYVDSNFTNSNFEQLQNLSLKIFEDNVKPILQRKFVLIYSSLLDLRFQIDKEIVIGKKKKNSVEQGDIKGRDKVSEMLNFCMSLILKNFNIKFYVFEVLYVFLIKNKENIFDKNLEELLEFLINCISKLPFSSENDPYKIRDALCQLMSDLCRFLSRSQTTSLFQQISRRLKENNIKSDHIILFLLRIFLSLTHQLGTSIFEILKKTNELAEIICPFLKHNNLLIKLTSCHIFKTFSEKNPKWKSNILSLMLNLITVRFAELEASEESNQMDETSLENSSGLLGHSICLSLLLRNIDFNLQSIPFDIANSIFETSKNLITSKYSQNLSLTDFFSISYTKRQSGWILLEQLLSFDIHWIGSKLKLMFALWQQQFTIEKKEYKNQDELIADIRVRIAALKTLRVFLRKCRNLHTDHVLKLIGSYLMNFYSGFVCDNEKEKKKENSLLANEMNMAKIELFRCLCSLSPRFYQQKLNLLVQNSLDDIFLGSFCNMIGIIKRFVDHDDILIAKNLEEQVYFRSVLFKHDHLKSEVSIEKHEQIILDYDQKFLWFREKNHALKQNLCRVLIEFLGLIYCSTAFTIKNKNNLLKYLKTNLKTILGAKDSQAKNLKIIPFLLIGVSIILKLRKIQENDGIYDNQFAENIKELSMICWSVSNSYIISLSSILYANLFGLQLENIKESLMKTLYENVTNTNSLNSVSTIIGFICKYNEYSALESVYLELSNIFQKASRVKDSKIWLLSSLNLCLENHKENGLNIFKACFSFLFLQYLLESEFSSLDHYLYSSVLDHYLIILSPMDSNKSQTFFTLQLQAFIIDLYGKFLCRNSLIEKKSKLSILSAFYNFNLIKKDHIFKILNLKYLVRTLMKLDISRKNEIFKVIEILASFISNGDFQKILAVDPDFNRNSLQKLNSINSHINPSRKLEETLITLYHKVLFEELKLKLSTFEENFNFFKEILFSDNFLFKETLAARHSNEKVMSDSKEIEKKAIISCRKVFKNVIRSECALEIEISPITRVFILKCAEQLLVMINLTLMKKQEIVNFSSLIITFLFKIITSNFEELREIGLKLFIMTFKKLKNYNENGAFIKKNEDESNEENLILQQYAVQLDAIISVNIKNESTNSPEINIQTFRLFLKFFKLFLTCDYHSIKKLFTLITKPLFNNLRIQPSPYYNEKGITTVHVRRLECISKMYFYLQKKKNLDSETQTLFSPLINAFLYQNIAALLNDAAIILTNSRSVIKNYSRFFFIYNGAKSSYDLQTHYETQSTFIKIFLTLKQDISSLIIDQEDSGQRQLLVNLKNNEKILPKNEDIPNFILSLITYNLCFNEAFEQNVAQNNKREKKFLKNQILGFFLNKIGFLENLNILLKKEDFIIELNYFNDILDVFNRFIEFGLFEIDNLIIQILENFNKKKFKEENANILIKIMRLIQIIFLRYMVTETNGEKIGNFLKFTLNLQKDLLLISLEFSLKDDELLKNADDVWNDEILNLSHIYIYSLIEILKNENYFISTNTINLNLDLMLEKLMKRFKNCENEFFENIILNYLGFMMKLIKENENEKTKNNLILTFLGICGFYRCNLEEHNDNSKIFAIYSEFISITRLISNSEEFKKLLNSARNIWQERKKIDTYSASILIEIAFVHILELKKSIQSEDDLKNCDQSLVIELLKFFLSIFLFIDPKNKEFFFAPFIELNFLFIHKGFSPLIMNLTDQILKHAISNVPNSIVEESISKFPMELQIVIRTILDNKRINEEKNIGNNNIVENEKNIQVKNEKDTNIKGTIKLKLFGSKN